jgi:hypothetical protein
MAKKASHEKKLEDPKGTTSPKLTRGRTTSTMTKPKRKQKLTARESMVVSLATPEYLKWSEVIITFDRSDHPDFIPKLGRYPLIVSSIIKEVKLNQVLVDGGSTLKIQFLKTFDQMGLSRNALHPS